MRFQISNYSYIKPTPGLFSSSFEKKKKKRYCENEIYSAHNVYGA